MSYKTIEEYFTQFPDDAEEIIVDFKTDYLPDLSRFYKLKILSCYNNGHAHLPNLPSTLKILVCNYNQLTFLPPLPSTLEELYCYANQLTFLPHLPSTLKILWCHYNQLTCLPVLPSTLEVLYCYNNQLTCLPPLPPYVLKTLGCSDNPFLDCYIKHENYTSMFKYIEDFRNQIEIINKFRELFYSLKYKKQFLDLLWVRIREPKIRNKYHPNNLIAMLEGKEESTLDELDELLEKW